MTAKKLALALALVLSATTAGLAQPRHHHGALYDYSPGYTAGHSGGGNAAPGDMGAGSQR